MIRRGTFRISDQSGKYFNGARPPERPRSLFICLPCSLHVGGYGCRPCWKANQISRHAAPGLKLIWHATPVGDANRVVTAFGHLAPIAWILGPVATIVACPRILSRKFRGTFPRSRATPETHVTPRDASVLSRLASVETRLETLENQVTARLPKVSNSPLEDVGVTGSALPEFHHGANHKILQYWSRLRVQMTIPDIHVLSYLKDAEATDMCGSRSGNPEHPGALIQLSLVKQALQTLDDQLHKLPIALGMILTTCRIYQDKELSIGLALARGTSNNEEPALRIWNLPTHELLLYAIAFKVASYELGCPTSYASETAEACFSRALDRLWDIFLSDDEEAMELLLTLTILHLDFFHQPYHALALLKITEHIMERLVSKQ